MTRKIIAREIIETDPEVAVVKPVATTENVAIVDREDAEAAEVGFKFYQIIYFIFGILEFIIGIRFLLKLFAANPNNAFVNFIYDLSYPFVYPFLSIFNIPAVEGSIVEWGTIVAMLVYALIAYGLVHLIEIITTKRGTSIQ